MKINGKAYASLGDLEEDARQLLPPTAYAYYASGAESQLTKADNLAAFTRWRLLPRCLVNVEHVDTSCRLFGTYLSFPAIIAPMAMQRMAWPEGEVAMAAAAAAAGIPMALSTMATSSIEEVAGAAGGPALWFQMYVLTRRDVSQAMVRQAEAAGFKALLVTVDAPRLGKRDADEINKFTLSAGLSLKLLDRMSAAAASSSGAGDHEPADGSKFGRHFTDLIDGSLTWEFLAWLKTITKLPIILKGILSPDDARKAVELGADGIVVSNHGGRQLDTCPASIDVLPFIAAAVAGRVPILVDGGVRRGTDVIKCMALGASAVLVGRPLLWALTLGGRDGVVAALENLRSEVELGMALLGCRSVAEVTADFVIPPEQGMLRLPACRL